jgi:hypothetical protein
MSAIAIPIIVPNATRKAGRRDPEMTAILRHIVALPRRAPIVLDRDRRYLPSQDRKPGRCVLHETNLHRIRLVPLVHRNRRPKTNLTVLSPIQVSIFQGVVDVFLRINRSGSGIEQGKKQEEHAS